MPPSVDQLKPKTAAEVQLILEGKRAFLTKHPASTRFLFEPSRLWGLIVSNRYIPPAYTEEDSELHAYDDLRLSFANFKAIAYAVLFGDSTGVQSADSSSVDQVEAAVVANSQQLSEKEKELIFYKHPFLSPKTFLMFERSVDNFSQHLASSKRREPIPETVAAVPLYTYIAKKMLLFRMRIMLELVASVPPISLRVASTSTVVPSHQSPPAIHGPPSASSPLSNALTQEDVESFIRRLVPHVRLVRDMPKWLLPYYLCHASRKIMFMLDPRNIGAISIESLMMSEVFSEFIRMYESEIRDAVVTFPVGCALDILPQTLIEHVRGVKAAPEWVIKASECGDDDYHLRCSVEGYENDGNDPSDTYTVNVICPKEYRKPDGVIEVFAATVPRDALVWCPNTTEYVPPELSAVTNWFSLPLMYRIYDHFTVLDADSDGVLTLEEFSKYSNSSYTDLSTSRVFEIHVHDAGGRHVMDFKSYLSFVVATEHVGTPQGKKYLWDVLDIEHTKDKIRVEVLRAFCKEISDKLHENQMSKITGESILSEIIDMINPNWHEYVTREDIDKCKQHHTVIPILLSHRNFYAYDCREQSAAQPSSEEYVQ